MMEEELSPPPARARAHITPMICWEAGGAREPPRDPRLVTLNRRAQLQKKYGARRRWARARARLSLEDVKATRARVREPRGGASEGEVSSLPFLLFFEMPGSRRSNRSNRSGRGLLATGHRSSGCVSVLVLLRRSVVK